MNVLIYLHNQPQNPIPATISDYDAVEFAAKLNGSLMFIELGGNIISRNMIMMITPASETTENAQ